jgi:tRNA-2-methylthio-N6-dimethylallyladenosine synthase
VKRYFYIATMGCQMNDNDSETVAQYLLNAGFDPIDNYEHADLIIINTCTVREKAQQKAFSLLGRMLVLKKKRPEIILGMMGCLAQQEGQNLTKKYPELNLVLGTRKIDELPGFLNKIIENNEQIVETELLADSSITTVIQSGHFSGRLKAYITIMEGCNNFCSYCIVPYVRGREKSRSSQYILTQAETLIKQGVKDITLLGQNVNSYHFQSETGEINFPDLLLMLNNLDGFFRIRFTTSHPKDLSEDLIDSFKNLNKLCPHIHLPFQSGSNEILEKMNRSYSREIYLDLVKKMRKARPDIAITSDVMVGFPGETEDDFNMTLDLIEKIEFDNLFSFIYSDRKGTLAEKMNKKISEEIKLNRLTILQEKQKRITLKKNKLLEGKIEEVLVEGISKKGEQITGRTLNNRVVNFTGDINLTGELVKVMIEKSFFNSLQGILIH